MGNAIWLTLAAFLLLFFSGFFYCFGRCCIHRRPRNGVRGLDDRWKPANENEEQLRLAAVRAEEDRKVRGKGEVGLPKLEGYDPTQPLTLALDEESGIYEDKGAYAGGYVQAPVGTRAVDAYYSPTQANTAYPPQPTTGYGQSAVYSTSSPVVRLHTRLTFL